MLDIIHLEEVIEEEEAYLLRVRIPKSLYPFYRNIFDNFQAVAENLNYKADIARQRGQDSKERRKREEEARDLETRTKMKTLYARVFKEAKRHRHKEAMKAVTHKFRRYWWVIKVFRKNIEAQRCRDISKLRKEGVTRRLLAKKFGCTMQTISRYSKKGGFVDGEINRGVYRLPQGKERLKEHAKRLYDGPETVRKISCG